MTTAWSELSKNFLSQGDWSVGQGPNAPDRQLFRALLRFLLRQRKGRLDVLEVGPGAGIEIVGLQRAGLLSKISYKGWDFTPEFVEHCQERFPDLEFEVRDVQEIEDKGIADVIWCRHVLEHVPDGGTALANLFAATREILAVSWFIRPTWREEDVDCEVSKDGFVHQTYSARRMLRFARRLGARVYRLDFDHHSTNAGIWIFSRKAQPQLIDELHRHMAGSEFLDELIPKPPDKQDEAVLDALEALYWDIKTKPSIKNSEQRAARVLRKGGREMLPELERYKRFVLWGFGTSLDSMRHIFRHYRHTLGKFGKKVIQVEDDPANLTALKKGDLVFGVDVEGHALRARPGVDYVLHNFDASHLIWKGLEEPQFLRLQVYTDSCEQYGVAWDRVRRYDRAARTLFQPWGTDLLQRDFMEPVFNRSSREVVFIGSIWWDRGLGNRDTIQEIERVVAARGLDFRTYEHISDQANIELVRGARFAPAIAGQWQVENNYLPCRCFKHPSYGVLAITNVPKFRELFEGCHIWADSIDRLIDAALALDESTYLDYVRRQQEAIAPYTYSEALSAIGRALEEGR